MLRYYSTHIYRFRNVTDVQYSIPNNNLDKYLKGEYFPANELYRYDDIVKQLYDEIKCERFDAMFQTLRQRKIEL